MEWYKIATVKLKVTVVKKYLPQNVHVKSNRQKFTHVGRA